MDSRWGTYPPEVRFSPPVPYQMFTERKMSVVLFLNDCSRKTKILSFRINKPTQKNETCFACLGTVKKYGRSHAALFYSRL
ncbi:hypothetical protein NXW10_22955 [Bacteroides fragilis]|nr:hypothetical protein NXW10_22955 [Bacteroides fragilis]